MYLWVYFADVYQETESKGPFLCYVRVFRGFLEPPSYLRKDTYIT